MSDPQRRDFLAGAAGLAASAVLLATRTAVAGDPSFMNNVPDPALSGKDLPTFKFALEKSEGKVIGNSYGKEATVTQPQPSGRSSSRGGFAPRSSIRAASPRRTTSTRATSGTSPAVTVTCCSVW